MFLCQISECRGRILFSLRSIEDDVQLLQQQIKKTLLYHNSHILLIYTAIETLTCWLVNQHIAVPFWSVQKISAALLSKPILNNRATNQPNRNNVVSCSDQKLENSRLFLVEHFSPLQLNLDFSRNTELISKLDRKMYNNQEVRTSVSGSDTVFVRPQRETRYGKLVVQSLVSLLYYFLDLAISLIHTTPYTTTEFFQVF